MRKQVSIVVYLTFICLAGCGQDVSTTKMQNKESSQVTNSHTEKEKSPVQQNQEKTKDENTNSAENPLASDEDHNNEDSSSQKKIIASMGCLSSNAALAAKS